MADAGYIAKAKAANREPVVLMAIESPDAIKKVVTTQADWESGTLTQVETVQTDEGVVVIQPQSVFNGEIDTTGEGPYYYLKFTFPFDCVVSKLFMRVYGVGSVWGIPASDRIRLRFQNAKDNPTQVHYGVLDTFSETGRSVGEFGITFTWADHETAPKCEHTFLQDETWYVAAEAAEGGDKVLWLSGFDEPTPYATITRPTGQVVTPVIDLGLVPTQPSTFSAEDIIPSGSTLAYSVMGGDTLPPSNVLGPVADGGSLPPYRYYQVTADFTSLDGSRPSLREIGISGGDSQFFYIGTHLDQPLQSVKPLLPDDAISALTSKIELLKPSTVGSIKVNMFWNRATGDMVATGYLRNKAVIIKTGFRGLSENQYEPFFAGTWQDYTADFDKGVITVELKDVLAKFKKAKLPEEVFDPATGAKTTTALSWTGVNVMQVMLDLIDAMGVPDRYIDRDAFTALRDGTLSGADWLVSRTITDPEEASKLLNELAVIAGVFLVPLPDGKLTPVLYDDTAAAVDNWDAEELLFSSLDGGQKDLSTRQLIYYDPAVTNPGENEEDYNKGYRLVDNVAEVAWNERAEKRWFEKWSASAAAVQALASRMQGWFASPKIRVKVRGMPPRYIEVLPGQIVAVNNLRIPVAEASWPGKTSAKKFLVMSKTVNPMKTTIDYELMEI